MNSNLCSIFKENYWNWNCLILLLSVFCGLPHSLTTRKWVIPICLQCIFLNIMAAKENNAGWVSTLLSCEVEVANPHLSWTPKLLSTCQLLWEGKQYLNHVPGERVNKLIYIAAQINNTQFKSTLEVCKIKETQRSRTFILTSYYK
jgi:hypothetical protein